MAEKLKIEKVGDVELPPRDGRYGGDEVRVSDLPKTVTGTKPGLVYTLADLARDGLVLYHPGFLLRAGYDPVRACWAEHRWDLKDAPYRVVLPAPVFHGATPPEDAAVYAVRPEYAGDLFRFLDRARLTGAVFGGDARDTVWDSVRQVVQVDDPFPPPGAPARPVAVHVYGLEGPTEAILWETVKESRRKRARVRARVVRPKPPRVGRWLPFLP